MLANICELNLYMLNIFWNQLRQSMTVATPLCIYGDLQHYSAPGSDWKEPQHNCSNTSREAWVRHRFCCRLDTDCLFIRLLSPIAFYQSSIFVQEHTMTFLLKAQLAIVAVPFATIKLSAMIFCPLWRIRRVPDLALKLCWRCGSFWAVTRSLA